MFLASCAQQHHPCAQAYGAPEVPCCLLLLTAADDCADGCADDLPPPPPHPLALQQLVRGRGTLAPRSSHGGGPLLQPGQELGGADVHLLAQLVQAYLSG